MMKIGLLLTLLIVLIIVAVPLAIAGLVGLCGSFKRARVFRFFCLVLLCGAQSWLAGCAPVHYHYFVCDPPPGEGCIVRDGHINTQMLAIYRDHDGQTTAMSLNTPSSNLASLLTAVPLIFP